jgi:hypothetical protein
VMRRAADFINSRTCRGHNGAHFAPSRTPADCGKNHPPADRVHPPLDIHSGHLVRSDPYKSRPARKPVCLKCHALASLPCL